MAIKKDIIKASELKTNFWVIYSADHIPRPRAHNNSFLHLFTKSDFTEEYNKRVYIKPGRQLLEQNLNVRS
jgi:hypothetical protein